MAIPTHRYQAYFWAVAVALACVVAAWHLSSPAGAAQASARDDNHLTCDGFLRRGSGVTHIVVKAEKKKDEDSWLSRPIWLSVETTPGWVGDPGFSWSTEGGLFRGCSNAITFAVVDARRDSALIGISLAQSFGAGERGRTADCQVLALSHTNARFTCHRYRESHLNGQLRAGWSITSP